VKIKKTIRFEFNQEIVQTPLLYQLNREFNVVINIRGASITEEGGFMALELEGEDGEVDRVVGYLKERGIEVVEELGETAQ
jgi:ABC-type methionine transport system ATPase subunit